MTIAAVSWIDAMLTDGQSDPKLLPGPVRGLSVGTVQADNDDFITLSRDVFDDGDVRGSIGIPRCCVLSIETFNTQDDNGTATETAGGEDNLEFSLKDRAYEAADNLTDILSDWIDKKGDSVPLERRKLIHNKAMDVYFALQDDEFVFGSLDDEP